MITLDQILEAKTSLADWVGKVTAPPPSPIIKSSWITGRNNILKFLKSLKMDETFEIDDEKANGQLVTTLGTYRTNFGMAVTGINPSNSEPYKVDTKGKPIERKGFTSTIRATRDDLIFVILLGYDSRLVKRVRKVEFK